MTPNERFWAKVEKTDGCWLWRGSIDGAGYGEFMLASPRRKVRAHRYAYEMQFGPIPDGLVIDHLCRRRDCVRPDHCEPVTFAENVKRGERPNRTHCPQGHEYDEANTYRAPRGDRQCRECMRRRNRAAYARKRRSQPNPA